MNEKYKNHAPPFQRQMLSSISLSFLKIFCCDFSEFLFVIFQNHFLLFQSGFDSIIFYFLVSFFITNQKFESFSVNYRQFWKVCQNYKFNMIKKKPHQKKQRFADVDDLVQRISSQSPKPGDYLYDYKLQQAKAESQSLDEPQFHKKYKLNFSDLPISSQTISGLTTRSFTKMTQIQRCVIPHALCGRDIMAASRTGSGKTLAYLVPLVEKLYRNKFIPLDGLGALVIVPVRELAMQVFEVLNSFTKNMEISVGLIIGGKDVAYEKLKIQGMNILVCTPGRLLQHLEETYGFETNNLQMLVLDEADQMLDIGFKETLDTILKQLPPRQTMLFSATLNKKVHWLASLSLNEPERIFLHSQSSSSNQASLDNMYETPVKLAQYYMVVPVQHKINTLYSFLKEHPKKKILIFLATCKEVRFYYESFKTFKFGCPLYELQGHQKQAKRMAIFYTFCQKQYGILFCTNIASRGLDFPQVDWVIQVDIPEDVETYVHRVGRTARFRAEGRALAFVAPSEENFVTQLKSKKIQIQKINQNPQKLYSIKNSLEARCSQNQQLKYLAQRALVSFLQFVFKAKDKEVFNVRKLDTGALASSLGLGNAPIIRFKKTGEEQQEENNEKLLDNNEQIEQSEDQEQEGQGRRLTKVEKLRMKMKAKKEQKKNILEKQTDKHPFKQPIQEQQEDNDDDADNDEDDQLLKFKRKHTQPSRKIVPTLSKRQLNKIKPQGHFQGRNKIIFDQQGNPTTEAQMTKRAFQRNKQHEVEVEDKFRERIELNRQADLETEKERRKVKRIKRKIREREEREAEKGVNVELAGGEEEEPEDADD